MPQRYYITKNLIRAEKTPRKHNRLRGELKIFNLFCFAFVLSSAKIGKTTFPLVFIRNYFASLNFFHIKILRIGI